MQLRRFPSVAVAVAYALVMSASVLAAGEAKVRVERHAQIGQTVRLGGHVNYQTHCSGVTETNIIVIRGPSHGTLAIQDEIVTSERPELGVRCAGHSGMGRVVYYTRTSAGLDKFRYDSSSIAGVVHVEVTVD
jgi:hypothetical protein